MVYALGVQRFLAGIVALIALLWAGLVGEPILGLWLAVWVVGLSCVGIGALVLEDDKRRFGRTQDTRLIDRMPARQVMASGFGYLTVGMLAGWFHPIAATTFLVLVLVDFAAGHHIAQTVEATSARTGDS